MDQSLLFVAISFHDHERQLVNRERALVSTVIIAQAALARANTCALHSFEPSSIHIVIQSDYIFSTRSIRRKLHRTKARNKKKSGRDSMSRSRVLARVCDKRAVSGTVKIHSSDFTIVSSRLAHSLHALFLVPFFYRYYS